jgi:hypothetical protein
MYFLQNTVQRGLSRKGLGYKMARKGVLLLTYLFGVLATVVKNEENLDLFP